MPVEIWLYSESIKYKSLKDIPLQYNLEINNLSIMDEDLTGISHIGKKYPNLTHLNVSCNKIKKIDLKYFPNLIDLCANKNKITEIIGLSDCLNLEALELQSNKIRYLESSNSIIRLCVPDNNLKFINNYPNLEMLGISENINFKDIINCPKIKYIHAYNTLLDKKDFDESIHFESEDQIIDNIDY